VILVDANLLVYPANRAAPEHEAAREWLDTRLNGTARVGLPGRRSWPSSASSAIPPSCGSA